MTHFLGTHQNRLDAKGRVSVPASFRTTLRDQPGAKEVKEGIASMVLRVSHKHPCIEVWPVAAFQELATPLEQMDIFSEDHDDLASAVYAEAYEVDTDREGRIVLPESLMAHAGVTDTIVFMGLGRIFQIWEPAAAERRRAEARERAKARSLTLPRAAA